METFTPPTPLEWKINYSGYGLIFSNLSFPDVSRSLKLLFSRSHWLTESARRLWEVNRWIRIILKKIPEKCYLGRFLELIREIYKVQGENLMKNFPEKMQKIFFRKLKNWKSRGEWESGFPRKKPSRFVHKLGLYILYSFVYSLYYFSS